LKLGCLVDGGCLGHGHQQDSGVGGVGERVKELCRGFGQGTRLGSDLPRELREESRSSTVCPVGAVSMTTYRSAAAATVRAKAWKIATSSVQGERRSSSRSA
jgi:hypothetical protein